MKKYDNVVKVICIWRGLTVNTQTQIYEKCVAENELKDLNVTTVEDIDNGGQHDWFIFHNGELTDNPNTIIDDLIADNDERIL